MTDDMASLRAAALAGVGVVQLPEMLIGEHIAAGRLKSILPQWVAEAGMVLAVFPSRSGLIPAVRRLLDFLADEFARLPAAAE